MSQLTVSKKNAAAIHAEAHAAAVEAAVECHAPMGERDACGFAWITITPARGPLVTWMKKNGIGNKPYGQTGYQIWNPSNIPTQAITAKERGAEAYRDVLRKYGVDCYMGSRLD